MAPSFPSSAVHGQHLEYKQAYMEEWAHTVSVTDGRDTRNEQETTPDNLTVSALYDLCLQVFRSACCYDDRSDSCLRSCISTISMKNEITKFHLWGDDLQLDLVDRSLESADFLKKKILQLLLQIGRLLLRGFESEAILCHSDMSFRKLHDILHSHPRSASQNLEVAEPDSHAFAEHQSLSDESGEESEDNVAEIPIDISFRTGCLQELTPLIKSYIVRAEQPESPAATNVTFTVSGPAYYYVQNVQEKFEKAPIQLVERLGEANWQRHVRLRQLADDCESNQGDTLSAVQPQSNFHDSGVGTMEVGDTNYAPSNKSHSSFVSSNALADGTDLRVPPAPVGVKNGEPFLCDFCGLMQYTISNRVDWKMHVFWDLRPYICTFENCPEYLLQFKTRAAWGEHEFSKHRFHDKWQCLVCSQLYPNSGLCKAHLKETHNTNIDSHPDEEALFIQHKIQSRPIEQEMCHICGERPAATKRAFLKHVGRHMEKIALMALPVTDNSNEDDDSVQSEGNDVTHGDDTANTQSPELPAISLPQVASPSTKDFSKTDPKNEEMLPPYSPDADPAVPLVVQADTKKGRGRAAPRGRCHGCNRSETPEWRRGPDGAKTLCNACGLHYAKLTRKMGMKAAASAPNRGQRNSNDTEQGRLSETKKNAEGLSVWDIVNSDEEPKPQTDENTQSPSLRNILH